MKKYKLTPEHEAQLKPWADKWIANAMSTKAMDDNDRYITREAVKGLYISAGLIPPPDHRIVFVSSPFIMRFAAGFASAIWYARKNPGKMKDVNLATSNATLNATLNATYGATDNATLNATRNATLNATLNATYGATDNATYGATRNATSNATLNATYGATSNATSNATDNATLNATDNATSNATRNATLNATLNATYGATLNATDNATLNATLNATYGATDNATLNATLNATDNATSNATSDATTSYFFPVYKMVELANILKIGQFGLNCAQDSWKMWQGGNQWSAWVSFQSFFRYVAKLDIDYSKWDHWEKAAVHSGPRIMHEEFCIISDRPEVLCVDTQNRPHHETGPFCQWRDGSRLYALNGIPVPMWAIETPKDQIPVEKVLALTNTEQRMALMRHIGLYKFLDKLGAEKIDESNGYQLYYLKAEGIKIGPYLYMKCPSSGREFLEGCGDAEKYENIDPNIKTCEDALRWRMKKASNELMTKFNLNWEYKA